MSWCPKCKMEYRSEIKECADCHIPLVEELSKKVDLKLLAQLEKEEQAEKLIDFLHYSGIYSPSLTWNNKDNLWDISVSNQDMKASKKFFSAFYATEKEAEATMEKEKEEQNSPSTAEELYAVSEELNKKDINTKILNSEGPSSTFIKQEDRYQNFHSSGYTFFYAGLLCLAFTFLNIFGILHFIAMGFQAICMVVISFIFMAIGISSYQKAKSIHSKIGEEEKMLSELNQWLSSNITDEILSQMEDSDLPDEVNYFHKAERIKTMLHEEFDPTYLALNDAMLDEIIEEYFDR